RAGDERRVAGHSSARHASDVQLLWLRIARVSARRRAAARPGALRRGARARETARRRTRDARAARGETVRGGRRVRAAAVATRHRVRELATLIEDQKVVAETLLVEDRQSCLSGQAGSPVLHSALQSLEEEKSSLLRKVPELIFAEERENSVARTAAREAETARLSAETIAREQRLRELFAQLPQAEQALREALETRRAWLWKQL